MVLWKKKLFMAIIFVKNIKIKIKASTVEIDKEKIEQK